MAHHAVVIHKFQQATMYIAATLLLAVFLGIKGYEYTAKFDHDILPGHIGEVLPGSNEPPDALTDKQKEECCQRRLPP